MPELPTVSTYDAALVARMARGDRAALAELYARHASRLMSLLVRLLGQVPEAQDVLQDVFLEVWRCAADFSAERGSVSAWLSLRARSRALDRLRAAPRSVGFGEELLANLLDQAHDPARTADCGRLLQVLQEIAVDEREVLVLGYFEDLSSSEIAARLNLPVGTVKSRTRTALEKLRRRMSEAKP